MKQVIFLFLFLTSNLIATAQEQNKSYFQHSAFAEFLGHSVSYGLGYDLRWRRTENPNSFGVGSGLGRSAFGSGKSLVLPLRAFYCYGKGKSAFETGLVYRHTSQTEKRIDKVQGFLRTKTTGYSILPYAGYRFQPISNGGLFFRAYCSPFSYSSYQRTQTVNSVSYPTTQTKEWNFLSEIGEDDKGLRFLFSLGISIGYTFKSSEQK